MARTKQETISTREAAEEVLKRAKGPLPIRELTDRIIKTGKTSLGKEGKRPEATVSAQMVKAPDVFVRTARGEYGLKGRDRAARRQQRAKETASA